MQRLIRNLPKQSSAPKPRPNCAIVLLPNSMIFAPVTKPHCGRTGASPEKNRLTAADAQRVEEAFQARLATLTTDAADLPQSAQRSCRRITASSGWQESRRNRARSKVIDKSVLTLPEPRRIRDRDHVKFVAQHPCLICGRQPSDAHHLRFAQSRALGRKVSDEFTVPLCRGHHREVHRCGDEAAWWKSAGIDPSVSARALWLETHPLPVNPDMMSCATMPSQRDPGLRA